MWFEILPSALVITTAFSMSSIGIYAIHKIFLKNAYKRDMRLQVNRANYLRDRRLTNNPYLYNGLETITDDDEDECNVKCKPKK